MNAFLWSGRVNSISISVVFSHLKMHFMVSFMEQH